MLFSEYPVLRAHRAALSRACGFAPSRPKHCPAPETLRWSVVKLLSPTLEEAASDAQRTGYFRNRLALLDQADGISLELGGEGPTNPRRFLLAHEHLIGS